MLISVVRVRLHSIVEVRQIYLLHTLVFVVEIDNLSEIPSVIEANVHPAPSHRLHQALCGTYVD